MLALPVDLKALYLLVIRSRLAKAARYPVDRTH